MTMNVCGYRLRADIKLRVSILAVFMAACTLLSFSNLYAIEVIGEIPSEEWTTDDSPYYVIGNIFLSEHSELTITSGVEVIFLGNYTFTIQGAMIARGSENRRIRFSGDDGEQWGGLIFRNCDPTSQVVNCNIENAFYGIDCYFSNIDIMGDSISATAAAINCDNSSPNIIANYLLRVQAPPHDIADYRCISIENNSSPIITDNKLIECVTTSNTNAYGIWIDNSSAVIERNWIEVTSSGRGIGIFLDFLRGTQVSRNIIRIHSARQGEGLHATNAIEINFLNNDIVLFGTQYEVSHGLYLANGASIKLLNNIIIGNNYSIGLFVPDSGEQENPILDNSGYNCYYNHTSNYSPGIWRSPGDLSANPLLKNIYCETGVDSGYFPEWDTYPYISPTKSPCIDNGYNAIGGDFPGDTTRCDIGRFWFIPPVSNNDDTTSVELPDVGQVESFTLLSVSPNPFNATTTIEFNLLAGFTPLLKIANINGRMVQQVQLGELSGGTHLYNWNAAGLPSGEYFIVISGTGMKSLSTKVVLLR